MDRFTRIASNQRNKINALMTNQFIYNLRPIVQILSSIVLRADALENAMRPLHVLAQIKCFKLFVLLL